MKERSINPHWVGERPAWDIVLPNGEIHKDVTDLEIKRIVALEVKKGNASYYDAFGLVTKGNIQTYCKHFETR